jgi:hypothetical protein
VYELYYNDGGLTQIAPDALDPETVWSGEIEHTHAVGGRSHLVASVFASQIDDLITLGTSMDDLLVFQNSTAEVRALGGEMEARIASDGGAWLGAAVSYTHLDSEDAAVLVNSAELVAALRGLWPVRGDRLTLAADVIYNSPRDLRDGGQTGNSVLANLFLSGALTARHLRYRVGVINALDWDRRIAVGEELVQRSIAQTPRAFVAELVYHHD